MRFKRKVLMAYTVPDLGPVFGCAEVDEERARLHAEILRLEQVEDSIRAALAAERALRTLRPMSEAPQDGTPVLLRILGSGDRVVAQWKYGGWHLPYGDLGCHEPDGFSFLPEVHEQPEAAKKERN